MLVAVVAVMVAGLALLAASAQAQTDPSSPYTESPCEPVPCETESVDTGVLGGGVERDSGTRVLGVQVSRDLAVTGTDVLTLVAVGGVAILAGFGFRTLSRRRVPKP